MFYLTLPSEAIEKSESDAQRSQIVFDLLNYSQNKQAIDKTPRTIIQFWDKKEIPTDVLDCMDSWKFLKSLGFDYKVFSQESAQEYIATNLSEKHLKAFLNCYHPAMKSDYFRLCYIYCSGGMYVDSDEVYTGKSIEKYFEDSKLKLHPLCYDIDSDAMVSSEHFIGHSYKKSRLYYFNNNPLISGKNNPVVQYALERATNILNLIDFRSLPEIQSTAGPGNLTASVVALYVASQNKTTIEILTDWEIHSNNIWSLSYRNDARNWRLSNRKMFDEAVIQGYSG